jgi:type VI secretion system protein ImpA
MPSPPTIDIEALIQPIPGDDPAGGPLPAEPTRKKLDDFREEFDPEELDPSDPRRNDPSVEKKSANWQAVIDLGEETLKDTSKSLLVAVRMTEALTMQHGLTGARDGFRLLRRLAEECWDRTQPKIDEPDDIEIRAGMYVWLDDKFRGARYPSKLRSVPIVYNGSTPVSYIALRGFEGQPPVVTTEQASATARATDPERAQNILDDVNEALEEVNRLGDVLNEKMPGDIAPGFSEVRRALEDCQTIAQWIRQENVNAGGGAATENGEAGEQSATGGGGGAAAGGAMTRDGIYREMIRLADRLAQIEPHSPVPDLIRQAVKLERVRFAELVDELTKDANVLAFLKREIGQTEGG